METAIARQLVDKIYEKRKAAALDLEKQIRECHLQGDEKRISQIIDQLVDMFCNPTNALHIRNGGLIGLAGTAIALGVDIAHYMEKFVEPLLVCFTDPENRIRYFSAECLYNIAKVSKGEVLVYFNPIFDALSKLAADPELSVKNGAELLDRLLKDIVAESASVYIPQYPETEKVREQAEEQFQQQGVLVPHPDGGHPGEHYPGARKAFSLAHFIPLLADRIYVLSPFTRSFLVAWMTVLDSVPELELISYLPEFFDGLLKYLSDPTPDVRVATENLLADFLREIRDVTIVRKRSEEQAKAKRAAAVAAAATEPSEPLRRSESAKEALPDITLTNAERASFISENSDHILQVDGDVEKVGQSDAGYEGELRDSGDWTPGQGVWIDYPAIIEILIQQLDSQHDEIQQSTALRWLSEFLNFASEVIIPFTPRLIPAILPSLATHVHMIQTAAIRANQQLMSVIQALPSPVDSSAARPPIVEKDKSAAASTRAHPASPTPGQAPPSRQSTLGKDQPGSAAASRDVSSPESAIEVQTGGAPPPDRSTSGQRSRGSLLASEIPRPLATVEMPPPPVPASRPQSPVPEKAFPMQAQAMPPPPPPAVPAQQTVPEEPDPFDYQETVRELTICFLSTFEETRVAALKWMIMLHQKSPKILADDATFPALLKNLSDESEEVIKHDLQLLAQISASSDETYFKGFMVNLLALFSTDRKLLETRGSFIIRQLCLNLNTERIYKTFAEILEKEDDLEFASVIVQKLNLILITSPELADFRKRLKTLETRHDGQALFTTLYRSWCHNALSVFSLCLLSQAYEHASNLLYIFAELEITVQMLVQVDKLVQLIESPVFTYLRLQLLEPDRYPHLFKCLYGLLMLLPQSSAFVSLRNRLNAVNSAGYLHIAPKPSSSSVAAISSRSKLGRGEEIKWQELLQHFRLVQFKHEKARRQSLGNVDTGPLSEPHASSPSDRNVSLPSTRPPIRRKVTGEVPAPPPPQTRSVLSPLNPRSRPAGLLASALQVGTGGSSSKGPTSPSTAGDQQKQQKRAMSAGMRKP